MNDAASKRTMRALLNWIKHFAPENARFVAQEDDPVVRTKIIRMGEELLQTGDWECPWCATISNSLLHSVPIGSSREEFEERFVGLRHEDFLAAITTAMESKEVLRSQHALGKNLNDPRELVDVPKLDELVLAAKKKRLKNVKKDKLNRKKKQQEQNTKQPHRSLAAIHSAGSPA